MRIGFFELEGWEEKFIREAFAGHDLYLSKEKIDEKTLPEQKNFEVISVFIRSHITTKVLKALPRLKLVTTRSTGYDHLDIEACRSRGVAAAFVPGYGDNTVAEFAFGLILALSRKICEARARVKNEGKFTTDGLVGFDLAGRTLGVIGTGRIGKHAVRIGKGFGMNVVAYDVYHDDAFAKEMGFPYVELEELLAQSDIATIHCPYLPTTHHLINKSNIGFMKRGAYLINTARGAILETGALISALKSGQLRGAGIDVLEDEDKMKIGNMSPASELLAMPNVIITPHNAFNSEEALKRILDITIDNIKSFVAGKPVNLAQEL